VVRKLGQRGIAGICIEDKLFPKTNSFIGEGQPLADMDEFCGKIKAGKDSQEDPDFSVVARIEALISGWGMEEALRRAEAYHQAGADAILIHSKKNTADEILAFLAEWRNRCPVIIVPTTYYETPTDAFRDAGVSMVIWANHNLRASIAAMREVSRHIQRDEAITGVENQIASLKDVFELAGNRELAEAERRYLPASGSNTRAIVLAASRGSELGELTRDRPKCMIDVRGQPLLKRLISVLNQGGIRGISVVRGYKKEMINFPAIDILDNDAFADTGELATLAQAEARLTGETVIAYGDILFRHQVLDHLMETEGDIVLCVDALWRERDPDPASRVRDLVQCGAPFTTGYLDADPVMLKGIGPDIGADDIDGEWIGLARLSAKGTARLRVELEAMREDGTLATAGMVELFQRFLEVGEEVRVVYVAGQWLDVDNAADLADARRFL
jgi:phosphoenolpyruvate phosphomutase